MSETRYTLSLPSEIYEELRAKAHQRGMSIKEVVRQCLKFGLIAMKIDEDPNSQIIIREQYSNGGSTVQNKETMIQFL